jgi:cell division protein FtsB
MTTKYNGGEKVRNKEERFFQVVLFLLTLFLIGYLSISNYRINKKRAEIAEEVNILMGQVRVLEDKKEVLETGISETEKDSYWEEKVREQGYIKEGEHSVVVIPPSETEIEQGEQENSFSQKIWQKIKSFFENIQEL